MNIKGDVPLELPTPNCTAVNLESSSSLLLVVAAVYGYYPSVYTLQFFYYSGCLFVFVLALFFSSRNDPAAWIKLAVVAAILAGYKVFTYVSKIKAFYKEKQ